MVLLVNAISSWFVRCFIRGDNSLGVVPCSILCRCYGGVPVLVFVAGFNVGFTIQSDCMAPVVVVFSLLAGIFGVSRCLFLFFSISS